MNSLQLFSKKSRQFKHVHKGQYQKKLVHVMNENDREQIRGMQFSCQLWKYSLKFIRELSAHRRTAVYHGSPNCRHAFIQTRTLHHHYFVQSYSVGKQMNAHRHLHPTSLSFYLLSNFVSYWY